jgi:hypothetical protein
LLTLGMFLPLDVFGYCRVGPCAYPYVLLGYPLALAVGGATTLALGAFLLSSGGFRRDRRFHPWHAARRRVVSERTTGPSRSGGATGL